LGGLLVLTKKTGQTDGPSRVQSITVKTDSSKKKGETDVTTFPHSIQT